MLDSLKLVGIRLKMFVTLFVDFLIGIPGFVSSILTWGSAVYSFLLTAVSLKLLLKILMFDSSAGLGFTELLFKDMTEFKTGLSWMFFVWLVEPNALMDKTGFFSSLVLLWLVSEGLLGWLDWFDWLDWLGWFDWIGCMVWLTGGDEFPRRLPGPENKNSSLAVCF